jgi:hypothetical protein
VTFADLKVGDHFIWPPAVVSVIPDSINVNIKIAWGDDGGGFATDLATRLDCVCPLGQTPGELAEWIPGATPVIKLSGRF